MSTNKDLLKQAIAEAKTIREAAIANAKEALEESITPHLKEMLAKKLQEMENDEMEEEISEETINGAETESYSENPRRHGNVLREEEDEEAPEEDEEEPTEEEEDEEGEEEELNIEDMSVEDLKDLIRDIVAQETGAEDGMEDELPADDMGGDDMTSMEDEEEIDINELLRELEEGSHEDEMEEGVLGNIKGAVKKVGSAINTGIERVVDARAPLARKVAAPGGANNAIHREGTEELNEALKTVKILRNQLQEVNLLNAKLLYVNKVFKANNLTEGQKVNVVAAFDKAETVKEVKLVFETVSKNVVAKQPAKPAIREHKSFASKPAGSTQKQVINEVSEAVNRMQILAGIKERQF